MHSFLMSFSRGRMTAEPPLGHRPDLTSSDDPTKSAALRQAGISRDQAATWERPGGMTAHAAASVAQRAGQDRQHELAGRVAGVQSLAAHRERQREGIAKAKAAGKYKGRPVSITRGRPNSERCRDALRSPRVPTWPAVA